MKLKKASKRSPAGGVGAILRRLVSAKQQQQTLTKHELAQRLKEITIHISIANHLRDWAYSHVTWWHTPNGEKRDPQTAAKLQRMGVKAGVHDFLIVDEKRGQLYSLEVKRQGETMTAEQVAFIDTIRAIGGRSACVDSFAGAVQQLEAWALLRIKIGDKL